MIDSRFKIRRINLLVDVIVVMAIKIDFVSNLPASSVYKFMLSDGWFSINDDICFQFPYLFHPIEMKNPPTTSIIYWAKNQFAEMADLSKLYISKQDAGLDRPKKYTFDHIEKELV